MTQAAGADEEHLYLPAFSYRQFRLLWVSALSAYVGRWIETVVGGWLVLMLTNSPLLVGLLGTCRFISMLLGPLCGTVSDRFDRRSILLTSQAVYVVASLSILLLFVSGLIQTWHLFVFTFVSGICYAFNYSTWYTAAAHIVKNRHIMSAASLLQVANGVTSVVGPLIGGGLLDVIGPTGCFSLITASFLLALVSLLPMKIEMASIANKGQSIWKNLVSGLKYIRGDRVLFSLVFMAAATNLFIFPYSYALIPIFARDILNIGAAGYGELMASAGFGAVMGSLLVGALPSSVNRGKLAIAAFLAWPVSLIFFAYSRLFLLSMGLLILAGIAQGISMTLVQTILLLRSSEEMRGRVSGARALAISTLALGTLLTGWEAGMWGVSVALVIDCVIFAVITLFVAVWASELLRSK
ncbi:MAG: MFS transporter [Dehalococcoidales bacterium]|nr:MFS transporter [Dehalococcoidales bacterium]